MCRSWVARCVCALAFTIAVLEASVSLAQPAEGLAPIDRGEPGEEPLTAAAAPDGLVAASPEPTARHSLLTAIDVEPGATCISADKLIRRVERWLQQTKIDARIRVRVRGHETEPFRVAFSIDRGDGRPAERTIDNAPEDCEQLHSALALSVALAIDASLLIAGAAGLDLPDDALLLEDASAEQGEREREDPLRLGAAVLAQLGTGVISSDLAPGVRARLQATLLRVFELRAGLMVLATAGQRVEAAQGSFVANIWAGRGEACGVAEPADELRVALCAVIASGRMHTSGRGFSESIDQTEPWSAFGGGAEVQVQLASAVAIAIAADVLVPFAERRILVVDPAGAVIAQRELNGAGVWLGAGLVFRIF